MVRRIFVNPTAETKGKFLEEEEKKKKNVTCTAAVKPIPLASS